MDAGDFGWKTPRLTDSRLAQQRRKATLQLESFALVGIDGVVPGDGDLAMGHAWLAATASRLEVPLIAANLVCDGSPLFPSARTVELAGQRIGLIGILGESLKLSQPCMTRPVVPAVEAALTELGPLDLVVVLSHQEPGLDEGLARDIPQIDLIVNGGAGSSFRDPRPLPNNSLQLAAGSRGKQLGVATLQLQAGARGFRTDTSIEEITKRIDRYRQRLSSAEKQVSDAEEGSAPHRRAQQRVTYYTSELEQLSADLEQATQPSTEPRHSLSSELVDLSADVADHPETAALLEQAMADIEALEKAQAPVAAQPAESSPFLGSGACQGCHPAQSAHWKSTRHAHAWATLEQAGRQMDLDCYSCHVTGAFHPEGVSHPTAVGLLTDVGCEACHGPGRGHPENPAEVKLLASPGVEVCTQCHDGVRDEGRFEAEPYLSRVRH